jgi:copper(I)-binding protein
MFRIHVALSILLLAVPALAGSFEPAEAPAATVGPIELRMPMIRATPPNAPVAGGFLAVTNTGDADDTLVAASAAGEVAGRMELHEMEMREGVMRMREVEGGIPVPAGETVLLVPGGLHLMLMDLAGGMEEGEAHEITLTFAEAGEAVVEFEVLPVEEIRARAEAMMAEGTGE